MDRDELLDDNDGVFDPENFPEEFREARGKHTNTIAMSLEGAFGLAIRDIVEEVVEDLFKSASTSAGNIFLVIVTVLFKSSRTS